MAVFCVARKEFVNQLMGVIDLGALVEMLRRWYLVRAGEEGRRGQIRIEARVYAFGNPEGDAIAGAISSRLPKATIDRSRVDEIWISAPPQPIEGQRTDLSIWTEVLAEPAVQNTCVILRLVIQGPVPLLTGGDGAGTATFVLCGAPNDGAILLKAMWRLGGDEEFHQVFGRLTAWELERPLLAALEAYVGQYLFGSKDAAAEFALKRFRGDLKDLFVAGPDERRIMKIVRRRAELPDERSPRAFARRLAFPLLSGIGLAIVVVVGRGWPDLVIVAGLGAAWQLYWAGSIIVKKALWVRKYYRAMRRGLGALYSSGPQTKVIDLSGAKSPSLLKASAEIEALGGKFVCDISPRSKGGEARIFAVGDTQAAVLLLNSTEKLQFFPAKPTYLFTTRFSDGTRHVTLSHAVYRKSSNPKVTARCLLSAGGAAEVWALHRRHVDRRIAGGAVVVGPAVTPEHVVENEGRDFEEGRVTWQKSPYSWGDAIHDAFKVCRREYLAD